MGGCRAVTGTGEVRGEQDDEGQARRPAGAMALNAEADAAGTGGTRH